MFGHFGESEAYPADKMFPRLRWMTNNIRPDRQKKSAKKCHTKKQRAYNKQMCK